MDKKQRVLRPFGSALAMGVPLVIGILVKDRQLCAMGAMGAFSYLAFQHRSFAYNAKAIVLHGIALAAAFILGAGTAMAPWSAPFVSSILCFSAFMLSKIFQIPKPNYFFVIMLYASGFNFQAASFWGILHQSTYLLYGLLGALAAGLFISLVEGLPFRLPKDRFQKLSVTDKYYLALYKQPEIILKALHFSMVLFIATYIAYLLRASNGYWVLISAAAVLAGEHMEMIKKRTVGRVAGSIVGLMLGFFLMWLSLPLPFAAVVLMVLNFLTELCMPINYTVANFFTNPQVLLLMTISTQFTPLQLIPLRFSGALIGSLLALWLIFLLEFALRQIQQSMLHSRR